MKVRFKLMALMCALFLVVGCEKAPVGPADGAGGDSGDATDLEENIGEIEATGVGAIGKLARRPGDVSQHVLRLDVRAPGEQTDVDAVEPQHGDQVQDPVPRDQREAEIGAGELEFHGCHPFSGRCADSRLPAAHWSSG